MHILNYIGPGLDGGVIAAVLGILTSIVLAFVAIIWSHKKADRKIQEQEEQMKIALFIVFFLLAVIADTLPFLTAIKRVLQIGTGSLETMRSKDVEDIKKEKILLANSLGMFIQSVKIISLILLVVICGALFIVIISVFYRSVSFGFLINYTISVTGLIISVAAFFSYFLIKKLYVKIRL